MKIITVLLLFFALTCQCQLLIPFEKDSLWGYCKHDSKAVAIAAQYAEAWPFKNGKAVVKKKQQYLVINSANKVISKLPYPTIDFDYGLAPVLVRGKYGFIDYSGKMVIAATYDGADAFGEMEKTTVQMKDQVLEINRKGDVLSTRAASAEVGMDFISDGFEKPTYVTKAHNGYAKYGYRFLFGYADSTGKVIAKAKYGTFSEVFVDSLCKVHYFTRADKMKYYKASLDEQFAPRKKDSIDSVGRVRRFVGGVQVKSRIGYIDARGVEYFENGFDPEQFEYEEYWPSGMIRRKCTFVYDQLDGTYVEYDEAGKIKMQLDFKKGVQIE